MSKELHCDMMNSWALTFLKGVDFFRISIEG
jgi:hypothetical protein